MTMTWNINDVRDWPPGSMMSFDNRDVINRQPETYARLRPHVALGVVVVNDGMNEIVVVCSSNCERQHSQYFVDALNPLVISRVR